MKMQGVFFLVIMIMILSQSLTLNKTELGVNQNSRRKPMMKKEKHTVFRGRKRVVLGKYGGRKDVLDYLTGKSDIIFAE